MFVRGYEGRICYQVTISDEGQFIVTMYARNDDGTVDRCPWVGDGITIGGGNLSLWMDEKEVLVIPFIDKVTDNVMLFPKRPDGLRV